MGDLEKMGGFIKRVADAAGEGWTFIFARTRAGVWGTTVELREVFLQESKEIFDGEIEDQFGRINGHNFCRF